VKILEDVGHDIKVVFSAGEKLVADLPKYIKDAEDAGADAKRIVPLLQNVVTASLAFAKPAAAIAAAVGLAGTNLGADETAIASILALVPSLQSKLSSFVAAVKALAVETGADWTQLLADLSATTE
jgi:hypothetical protein